MIKIENAEVLGWDTAIRGMRNPMNSWNKSDSKYFNDPIYDEAYPMFLHDNPIFSIGPNDKDLMKRLRNAGTDHRKFMRMIVVYVDITAPLYWWKEFDTYKVGTVANSCSTMHKIHAKEFTLDDFSHEHIIDDWSKGLCITSERNEPLLNSNYAFLPMDVLKITIRMLNEARNMYLQAKNKKYKKYFWWQMIQLLPSSYNQKRTVMLNYEVLANIYKSRKEHKLDEWRELCEWMCGLPYSELITGEFEE